MNDILFTPLRFDRGPALKNRILLAPLTNEQSNEDGTASQDDFDWIETCARAGYSMVMTCAAHVLENGKAFNNQLGIFDDKHEPGLRKIADIIRKHGGVSSVQLHHAGMRAQFNGETPNIGPSAIAEYNTRALALCEVEELRDAFIEAAARAERAGFDGVELHGAFGWILTQFLSPTLNRRTDRYGGPLENRVRLIFEIIDGIRKRCRPDFQIGVRFSFERYGQTFEDVYRVCEMLVEEQKIDFLDLVPWDVKKAVDVGPFAGRKMLEVFSQLCGTSVKVGTSGKVMDAQTLLSVFDYGLDFIMIGRSAILNKDFLSQVLSTPDYLSPKTPVTKHHLRQQGLSDAFIKYLANWNGFVE
ncbi:NADH:flavin oxidoreductase [Rhizobium sp. P38BS-XIX]|uniref:NADH:flavin oxidoreductase n=1 Tax=Rhizobium sp. P38BS-XIX TaxID=2726740 RepID=UPI001456CE3D|nr:NADH:flavin oxidoreductase [Rhizobium sp. P38BS-XIX]NLR99931.1 NADH:flavin oxidoreductase [Rhizobium sp. P38BS-XIX]